MGGRRRRKATLADRTFQSRASCVGCLTVDGDEDGGVAELLLRLQLVLDVGRDLDEVLLPDPLPVPDENDAAVGLRMSLLTSLA